jgi:mono/diheme cytochrome c family protein
MLKKSMFLTLIMGCIFIASCGGKEEPTCLTTGVTYTNTVKAILDQSCAKSGCHALGSSVGELNDYDKSKAFVAFGKMLPSIKHEAGAKAMPKVGTKLTDCQISQIEAWIAAGTPK